MAPPVRDAGALGQLTVVRRAPMSGHHQARAVAEGPEPTRRARLRLTRRARLGLAVLLAVAITAGAYLSQSAPTAAAGDAPSSVVVGSGDTLYSIATRVAPDADPRVVVSDLRVANDLSPEEVGALTPGDILVVPAD